MRLKVVSTTLFFVIFIVFSLKFHSIKRFGGNENMFNLEKQKALIRLKHYEKRYLRLLELCKSGVLPVKELEEAELNYEIAKIDIQIAELNLKKGLD